MIDLSRVDLNEQAYYKIENSQLMRPFFMSIVSDANHWMFIASNGGLTAGRKNSEFALFPYYTDDKITESAEITGPKTIVKTDHEGTSAIWEPFSIRSEDKYNVQRNIYKHIHGNRIIFEEINHDLQLVFRYRWESSNQYGFLRTATLENLRKDAVKVELLDGLQNILPYGVGSELQMRSSNLADAYKRSELHQASGLGIYALSAIIVDKAEPSEALKCNVVWSSGLEGATHLLSSRQLDRFRQGERLQAETDVKAEKGAYLMATSLNLAAGKSKSWHITANVNQDRPAVERLIGALQHPKGLVTEVKQDIEAGGQKLVRLTASADGLQQTADSKKDARHFSNVLFNIMRGGIFDNNYQIEHADFANYLKNANREVYGKFKASLAGLGAIFSLAELDTLISQSDDPDLIRLGTEYLPLKFSRRHGDPSRPWNKFSINTNSEVDGSKILDYEGNWRDIFQNWEALATGYPEFMEGMIYKFVNASTFDGYNPYRVVKGGFDWETIEPDDPWSYIGYWGDHQIIYLLKFLEFIEDHQPGKLLELMDAPLFTYANVPYRIKAYTDILKDPKDTVVFDHEADERIRGRREKIGADGALLVNQSGEIIRVNFLEKILATSLAKISNFVPEGGIWMNTQRPEWNDANNALVGNGVSMVTLYYLRRCFTFLTELTTKIETDQFELSAELVDFFTETVAALEAGHSLLSGSINDRDRKQLLDALGQAGSKYRTRIYDQGFSGESKRVSTKTLRDFCRTSLAHFDHTIRANRRADGLYHAYNLLTTKADAAKIDYLDEMLEGQVAVLSAKFLTPQEVANVLDSMRYSALYRPDQNSYILYPNKQLPGFLEKNNIPAEAVENNGLLQQLLAAGHNGIVQKDVNGDYHFNGNFNNAKDLDKVLNALAETEFGPVTDEQRSGLKQIFEDVFNHKAFTGRSGTFFGYEGLGSIYWHMVSKLGLAVMECCESAIEQGADQATLDRIVKHYYAINEGIGVHKKPEVYGAFPTDPYSHTPAGKGAQQPGMTGQVKEDILSRFGELGVTVRQGQIHFEYDLLRKDEFLAEAPPFQYIDLAGESTSIDLPAHALAFTYCQIPVVYTLGSMANVEARLTDGNRQQFAGRSLNEETSQLLFKRSGAVAQITVTIPEADLLTI